MSFLLIKWLAFILALVTFTPDSLASYMSAQQMFKRRNYVQAAPEFFAVYSAPRNRSERMKSEWGLAQSLQRLGLFYSASKYYSIIVRRGRSPKNPFFRKALEELGKINNQVSLGQAHINQLFKTRVQPSDVPGVARGFFFYYKGVDAFNDNELEKSRRFFSKVPAGSDYYLGAVFHLAVVANLSGNSGRAIDLFQRVAKATSGSYSKRELYESAIMNIARVHYEQKRYTTAISFYGRIPRDSDHWLDAIWETSWAFFFLQKFNNSLGQIHTLHSPFYVNRFYPESYILQAITFLRLCRYDQVKKSMRLFKDRYRDVFRSIKNMLNRYRGDPRGFFKLVNRYNVTGRMPAYQPSEEVIKKLTYVDSYKGARDTLRFSQREIEALRNYGGRWASSGLVAVLKEFLRAKKGTAVAGAGRRMYELATTYYGQLLDLSNQTKLIVAEMQLGKLARLREKISAYKQKSKVDFIGGLQQLDIGQSLEYWPFEQEYWEDELGFYVYNMPSRCSKGK